MQSACRNLVLKDQFWLPHFKNTFYTFSFLSNIFFESFLELMSLYSAQFAPHRDSSNSIMLQLALREVAAGLSVPFCEYTMSTSLLFRGPNIFDFRWMIWTWQFQSEWKSLPPGMKAFVSPPPVTKPYPITSFRPLPAAPAFELSR